MESFCLEIKTTCKNCGNPIMINALVNEIHCDSCDTEDEISKDNWDDIFKIPLFQYRYQNDNFVSKKYDTETISRCIDNSHNTGPSSVKIISADYDFSVLFGSEAAQCPKCKTPVPEEAISSTDGCFYICSQCNNNISVRKPDDYITYILPEVKFIVGEEVNQFNTGFKDIRKLMDSIPKEQLNQYNINPDYFKKPPEDKLLLFTCPACAASLKIDDSKRTITCQYCNAEIYLPDELWHELHPVKTVKRWYILIDRPKMSQNISDTFKCPECGKENKRVYRFCIGCGAALV